MRSRQLVRTSALIAALALGLGGQAWAHEARNTLVPPGQSGYLPGYAPDRIILVSTEDPARSQVVAWRTAPGGSTQAVAQLVIAGDSPGLHLAASMVEGSSRLLDSGNGPALHHRVRFEGLMPDTLYAYRVRGHDTWSEWLQFRTAPEGFLPFSFLYFGDAQNSVKSHFSRVLREGWRGSPGVRLMLFAGDMVNTREGNHDDEWGEWFDAGGFLHGMVPTLPVAGNHEFINTEYPDGTETYHLSPAFTHNLPVAGNGPEGLEETVYAVRWADVLFVALDSQRALDDEALARRQAEWLDGVLSGGSYRWIIVSHHHPLFSVARGRDNPLLREHWLPVYRRHGVDLVLQGHDHAYGRGPNLPEGVNLADGDGGPVFVVSVAGPKMYLASENAGEAFARLGEDVQLYQLIHVEADRLRFESRTPTGTLYDAFELRREADDSRRLLDLSEGLGPASTCANPAPPRPGRCWNGTELVDGPKPSP